MTDRQTSQLELQEKDEHIIKFRISWIGLSYLGCSSLIILYIISQVMSPFSVIQENFENKTVYIAENYQFLSNGSRYYMYVDEVTNEERMFLVDDWVEYFKEGMFVYKFGGNYNNYCWPREVPEEEWFKSLFKSTQLKASVQCSLRLLILGSMTFRIFQVILIASRGDVFGKRSIVISTAFMVNELLHWIVKFEVANYLITPDVKYMYIMEPSVILVHVTFALKMFFSSLYSKSGSFIVTRIFLAILAVQCYTENSEAILEYIEYPYCDEYFSPISALTEYGIVIILLIASVIDFIDSKNHEVVIKERKITVTEEFQ